MNNSELNNVLFNYKISSKVVFELYWRRINKSKLKLLHIYDSLDKENLKRNWAILAVVASIVIPYYMTASIHELTNRLVLLTGTIHSFIAATLIGWILTRRFRYEQIVFDLCSDLKELHSHIQNLSDCYTIEELEQKAIDTLIEKARKHVALVNSQSDEGEKVTSSFSALEKTFAVYKNNLLFAKCEEINDVGYFIRLANSKQS